MAVITAKFLGHHFHRINGNLQAGRKDQQVETAFPSKPQRQGPNDVKLLLNSQAPQVEHRLCLSGVIEIPAFIDQNKIGDERGGACHMLAKLRVFVGRQREPAKRQRERRHKNKGRKNSSDATTEEISEAEQPFVQIFEDMAGNQKPADDEENVDADKPASQPAGKRVKGDDRQDGERSQPIYFSPVGRFVR